MKNGERNVIDDGQGTFQAVKDFSIFDGFSCLDPDLDDFILNDAHKQQKELLSITYAYVLKHFTDKPIAFASLSNSDIKLKPDHPARRIIKNVPYQDFPAVKIGRLGVADEFQKQGLGGHILNLLKIFFTTNNRTGCRFLVVDAYNNNRVLKFYENNFFLFYHHSDSKKKTRIMYYDLIRPVE